MDMKKISFAVLIVAASMSAALTAHAAEAPATSAASAASGPAASGPSAPSPASGAAETSPFVGSLIGAFLLSFLAYYMQ
ncbi:hypothetical protein P3X46_009290 [Hevea brasiliensis]|uniref:Arabinogalactan peptide 23-like n=1 Tax=Hevea brasiliensis TaxID=3981 RepID=A0ABQ9MLD8_HEVBR|nr:arabinogalactan protein 23-like [Hevea brasiliensis]KAJ9181126.1 hypothetical protein P3X46_009290 [Hevea brasiliensis]